MRLTHLTIDRDEVVRAGFDDEEAPEGAARRVELLYEPGDSGLRLVSVTLGKDEGRLVGRDTRIPLGECDDQARRLLASVSGLTTTGPGAEEPRSFLPPRLAEAVAVIPERRKGRAVPDAFLRKVVDAYRAAGHSIAGLTPDLDPAFGVSDSTKYRWVKAARERGLLETRED